MRHPDAQWKSTAEFFKKLGVTEQINYRWRRECGGLKVDRDKKLKQFEKEHA